MSTRIYCKRKIQTQTAEWIIDFEKKELTYI